MIKYLCFLLIFILPVSCLAGISVVGTRFFIDDLTKPINIKIINDNENDYLVKTSINSDGFIISPPLFILQRNESNIITIIPDEKLKGNEDKVYPLTIYSIPKSELNNNENRVSLAVRSHFKLVYQHGLPSEKDFNEIKLIRSKNNKWLLINKSDFSFVVFLSKKPAYKPRATKLLAPNEEIAVNECSTEYTCSLWLTILDRKENILKTINLAHD